MTDEQRAWVRKYVGWTPPTDDDLDDRFDALIADGQDATQEAVAAWFVRAKLSELTGAPESFSVAGEYSESWRQNMISLRESLAEIESIVPGSGAGVVRMERCNGSSFR